MVNPKIAFDERFRIRIDKSIVRHPSRSEIAQKQRSVSIEKQKSPVKLVTHVSNLRGLITQINEKDVNRSLLQKFELFRIIVQKHMDGNIKPAN